LVNGSCLGVPIEVVPMARVPVTRALLAMGALSATTRVGSGKAGPLLTDNANFIVDADFGAIDDVVALEQRLRNLVGVVETGLFVQMASKVFFGSQTDETLYSRVNESL
jgi:ribose 5-phosphate isomerase A